MTLPIKQMMADVALVQRTLAEGCTDPIADVCLHCLALAAELHKLHDDYVEQISYTESVDAMLDGIIPSRGKDGKVLWLNERLQMLLNERDQFTQKLVDCWLLMDQIARHGQSMTSVRADCEKMLRKHGTPGWRKQDESHP